MLNNPNDKLVVVIPAYNEEGMIGDTLDALLVQTRAPDAIVVVDNNSTDRTRSIVESRRANHARIHIVHETNKGTGYACRAGFRFAIDSCGATVVARIDADTLPDLEWIETIAHYFALRPDKLVVTGPNKPRRDRFYRAYDPFVWPIYWRAIRLGAVFVKRSLFPLKAASGHNLAIRATTYDAVGGFTKTSIEEHDEDIALAHALCEKYGFSCMGYAPRMVVRPSMRRTRKLGYTGMFSYYLFPDKERRIKKTGGVVDIR